MFEINPQKVLEDAVGLILTGVESANGLPPGVLSVPASSHVTKFAHTVFGTKTEEASESE